MKIMATPDGIQDIYKLLSQVAVKQGAKLQMDEATFRKRFSEDEGFRAYVQTKVSDTYKSVSELEEYAGLKKKSTDQERYDAVYGGGESQSLSNGDKEAEKQVAKKFVESTIAKPNNTAKVQKGTEQDTTDTPSDSNNTTKEADKGNNEGIKEWTDKVIASENQKAKDEQAWQKEQSSKLGFAKDFAQLRSASVPQKKDYLQARQQERNDTYLDEKDIEGLNMYRQQIKTLDNEIKNIESGPGGYKNPDMLLGFKRQQLASAKQEADRLETKAKLANDKDYATFYDSTTYQPVPIERSVEALDKYRNEIITELGYSNSPMAREFQGKMYADLTPDQKRVVDTQFSTKYMDRESMESYLASNNYDLDLKKVPHSVAKFGKEAFGSIDKLLLSSYSFDYADPLVAQNLYDLARNGMITKAEFERRYSDLNNYYQEENKKGAISFHSPIEGITPLPSNEKMQGSNALMGTKGVKYSSDQIARWLSRMPSFEQIAGGAESPYTVPSMQSFAGKLGDKIKTNPIHNDSFLLSKLPAALGSSAAFLAISAMSGGAGLITTSMAGALMQAQSQFEDAIQSGATPDVAIKSFGAGLPVGGSEGMQVEAMLQRMKGIAGWKVLSAMIRSGTEEAIQETFQAVSEEELAKFLYDETRGIENVTWEGAGVGFVSGFLMAGFTNLASRDKSKLTYENAKKAEEAYASFKKFMDGVVSAKEGAAQDSGAEKKGDEVADKTGELETSEVIDEGVGQSNIKTAEDKEGVEEIAEVEEGSGVGGDVGTKVVDDKGNPLTVYHGTKEDFKEFDDSKKGGTDEGWWGKGFYFHTDKDRGGYGDVVKSARIDLKNPVELPVNESGKYLYDLIGEKAGLDKSFRDKSAMAIIKEIGSDKFTELAKEIGYDGVVVNYAQGTKEIVAFDKGAIKNLKTEQSLPTQEVKDNAKPTISKETEIKKLENRFQKPLISGNRSISDLQKESDGKIEIIDLGDGLVAWKMPKADNTTIQQFLIADANGKSDNVHQVVLNNKGEFSRLNEPNIKDDAKAFEENYDEKLNRLNEAKDRLEQFLSTKPTISKEQNKEATDFGKVISASSRFRPAETVVFDKPIIGKNGNKLISYQWAYEWTMQPSGKDSELKSKRISDWTQAESSAETGRDIVHKFTVERKDGTVVTVSSETIPSLLGYVDAAEMKNLPSVVSSVKTLAKQRMQLAILKAQESEYNNIKQEVEKGGKPNITVATKEELPFVTRKMIDSGRLNPNDFTYFKMGDETYRQDGNSKNPTKETIEQLTDSWVKREVENKGGKKPSGLYDLERRIERQEKKVEQATGSRLKAVEQSLPTQEVKDNTKPTISNSEGLVKQVSESKSKAADEKVEIPAKKEEKPFTPKTKITAEQLGVEDKNIDYLNDNWKKYSGAVVNGKNIELRFGSKTKNISAQNADKVVEDIQAWIKHKQQQSAAKSKRSSFKAPKFVDEYQAFTAHDIALKYIASGGRLREDQLEGIKGLWKKDENGKIVKGLQEYKAAFGVRSNKALSIDIIALGLIKGTSISEQEMIQALADVALDLGVKGAREEIKNLVGHTGEVAEIDLDQFGENDDIEKYETAYDAAYQALTQEEKNELLDIIDDNSQEGVVDYESAIEEAKKKFKPFITILKIRDEKIREYEAAAAERAREEDDNQDIPAEDNVIGEEEKRVEEAISKKREQIEEAEERLANKIAALKKEGYKELQGRLFEEPEAGNLFEVSKDVSQENFDKILEPFIAEVETLKRDMVALNKELVAARDMDRRQQAIFDEEEPVPFSRSGERARNTNLANKALEKVRRAFPNIKVSVLPQAEFLKEAAKAVTAKFMRRTTTGEYSNEEIINGFYSPLEKIISETKFEKLPAKQWIDKFAKGEEAKWTGLSDWLKQQDGSVSKADIQKYLKDNRIQVVEVVKGEVSNFTKDDIADVKINQHGAGNWVVKTKEDGTVEFPLDKADDKAEAIEYALEQLNYDNKSKRESKPKFQSYQTEGGKSNYKEVLVTLPSRNDNLSEKEYEEFRKIDDKIYYNRTFEEQRKYVEYQNRFTKSRETNKDFKSTHFDEPNILVHLRMNTRTDAEGKKVLFIEEVQSDWGQKGKKEGFDGKKAKDAKTISVSETPETIIDEGTSRQKNNYVVFADGVRIGLVHGTNKEDALSNAKKRIFENPDAVIISGRGTPPAPFVMDTNAWTKLGLKVALKEAVAQGIDKIAWTTGEQQNDRYDLSKQVDEIQYFDRGEEGYSVVSSKNKSEVHSAILTLKGIENTYGKEIAEKIKLGDGDLRNGGKVLSGQDLKVGGKGMIGFYGSPSEGKLGIIGEVAKKVFGQKVNTTEIDTNNSLPKIIKDEDGMFHVEEEMFSSKSEAQKYINDNAGDLENDSQFFEVQHSIEITPELRAEVQRGLPLFSKSEDEVYGFYDKNTGRIYLNEDLLNPQAALEEYGHLWLHLLEISKSPIYKAGVTLAKFHPLFEQIKKDEAYQDIWANDEAIANEVLAKIIQGKAEKLVNPSLRQKVISWAKNFWAAVRGMLFKAGLIKSTDININKLTIEKLTDMAAHELMLTTPITEITSKMIEDAKGAEIDRIHIGESIKKGIMKHPTRTVLAERISTGLQKIPFLSDTYLSVNMGAGERLLNIKERHEAKLQYTMARLEQADFGYRDAMKEFIKEHGVELALGAGVSINKYLTGEATLDEVPEVFHESVKEFVDIREDLTKAMIDTRLAFGDDIIFGVNEQLELYLDLNFRGVDAIDKMIREDNKILQKELERIAKLKGEELKKEYLRIRDDIDAITPKIREQVLNNLNAALKLKEWALMKSEIPALNAILNDLRNKLVSGVGTITPIKKPRRKVSEAEKQINKEIEELKEKLRGIEDRELTEYEQDLVEQIKLAADMLETEGERPMTEVEFTRYVQGWKRKYHRMDNKLKIEQKNNLQVIEVQFKKHGAAFDLVFMHSNGTQTSFDNIPFREVEILFGKSAADRMLLTEEGYYKMPNPEILMNNRLYARIMANKGKYMHRSYQMHDRADWPSMWQKIILSQPGGLDIITAAKAFLRERLESSVISAVKVVKDEKTGKYSISYVNNYGKESGAKIFRSLDRQTAKENWVLSDNDVKLIKAKLEASNEVTHYLKNPTQPQNRVRFVSSEDEVMAALTILVTPQNFGDVIMGGGIRGFDSSIFKEKGDIAKELRAIMGEYTDPQINITKTITKMAQAIKQAEFVREVLESGGPWVSTVQSTTHSREISKKDFFTLPTGKKWYITPEAENLIKGVESTFANSSMLTKAYVAAMGAAKLAHTVGYPESQSRNFIGAALNMFATGNFNVEDISHAAKIASQGMYGSDKYGLLMAPLLGLFTVGGKGKTGFDTNNKELRDIYLRATKAGIINESIDYNISETHKTILTGDKAKQVYNKVVDPALKAYAMADNTFKVAQWLKESKVLRKAYPDKSQEEIDIIAGDIVRRTSPTYSKLPRWVRSWSTQLPIGSFVSWPSAMILTRYEILKQASEEILSDNKVLQKKGYARMGSFLAMTTLTVSLAAVSRALFDWDDEDDKAVSDLSPWFARNNVRLYLSDDKINVKFLDLTYVDPSSMFYRPIIAWMREPTAWKKPIAAMRDLSSPYTSTDMFISSILEASSGKDEYNQRIWENTDLEHEKLRKQVAHVLSTLVPQIASSTHKMSEAIKNEIDPSRKELEEAANQYELSQQIPNWLLGVKGRTIDMNKSAASIMGYSYKLASETGRHYRDKEESAYSDYDYANKRAQLYFQEVINAQQALKQLYLSNGESDKKIVAAIDKIHNEKGIPVYLRSALKRGKLPELREDKESKEAFRITE